MKVKRDESLDQIKFYLILLVALCHSIEPFRYYHISVDIFYSLVYSFHMPLFVMISGYFSKIMTFKKLVSGGAKIFETYFVLCIVAIAVSGNKFEFISPLFSEWYLISLIFWRFSAWCVLRLRINKIIVLAITFALALVAFLLLDNHSLEFSSMRTMLFLPYFFIGFILTSKNIQWIRNHKSYILPLAFISVIVLLVCSVRSPRSLHVMEFNKDGLFYLNEYLGLSYIKIISIKAFLYIAGISLCILALTINRVNKRIASFGRYTLFLYCIQMYLLQLPMSQGFFTRLWIAVISAIFVMIFSSCVLTKNILLMNLITNPLSTIVSKAYFLFNKRDN